jgi:hypothetical protein
VNLTSAILCKGTSTSAQCIFNLNGGIVQVESLNSSDNAGYRLVGFIIQSTVASGTSFSQIANITATQESVGFFKGSPSLRSTNIVGCTSSEDTLGLVYVATSAVAAFTNCVILGNTVPNNLIFRVSSPATLTITGCSLQSFAVDGVVAMGSMRTMNELLLFLYVHGECKGRAGSSASSVCSPGCATLDSALRLSGCTPFLILLFMANVTILS